MVKAAEIAKRQKHSWMRWYAAGSGKGVRPYLP